MLPTLHDRQNSYIQLAPSQEHGTASLASPLPTPNAHHNYK